MTTAIETYGLRTPKQKKAFGKIQSDINESVKATMAKTRRLPWDSGVSAELGLPRRITGEAYKGKNVWIFTLKAIARGYTSNTWIGFQEISNRGGKVIKGEKATTGVNRFYAPFKCMTDCTQPNHCVPSTDKEGKKIRIRINAETGKYIGQMRLSWFNVFNAEQVDWSEAKKGKPCHNPTDENFKPDEYADKIIAAYLDSTGVAFNELPMAGEAPHYLPSKDTVNIPLKGQFEHSSAYYSVAFHEIGHSTSKKGRVERNFNYGMHSERGKEEMSVEWSAAYLSKWCNLENVESTQKNSEAYIQGWSEAIDKDPNLIFEAMDAADKIANFILKQCDDC